MKTTMAPTRSKVALRLAEDRWCVFVAPSTTAEAWIEAIRSALLNAGYRADSPWDYSLFGVDGPRRVLITTTVTAEERDADPHWVVLMPDMPATPFVLAGADVQHLIQYGRNASAILAPLADLPSDDTVVLTEVELSGRNTVEILPGLEVETPSVAFDRQTDIKDAEAVSAAMQLYALRPTAASWPVVWPPEFFLSNDGKTTLLERGKVIDLTGSPRPVVWGPHFHMPSGRWSLTIRFSIDENASRHAFSFEWGDLTSYSTLKAEPGTAGVYEAVVEHEWKTPAVAEMRISVIEGVFDGVLTFFGATVAPAD